MYLGYFPSPFYLSVAHKAIKLLSRHPLIHGGLADPIKS